MTDKAGSSGDAKLSAQPARHPFRGPVLEAFVRLAGVDDAFLLLPGASLRGRLPPGGGAIEAAARAASGQALASGRAVASRVRLAAGETSLACVPLAGSDGVCVAAISQRLTPQEISARTTSHAAWLAPAVGVEQALARETARAASLETALGGASAINELIARASGAGDFDAALFHAAEDLRQIFGATRVLLATRGVAGRFRIRAVSGVADLSKSGSGLQAAEALLEECASGGLAIRPGETRHPLARELLSALGCSQMLASALRDRDGGAFGGWVILWETAPPDVEAVERLALAAAPVVGNLARVLAKALPGGGRGRLIALWERLGREPRAALAGFALGIAALLAWPVPMPVQAEVEVAPKSRRIVGAPFDSILRKSRAEAGQMVTAGDLLAELDDRELRWQLAEAVAKKSRALRQAELAIKEDRIAEARAAELDAEGFALQERLLADRLTRLEVRAPITGVLLAGDLERVEGVPLRAGEPLFEIAPMERCVIRFFVGQQDAGLARPGQEALARFEQQSGKVWKGRIGRVFPRAEEHAGRSVFVAEMEVENEGGQLRAGVKGRGEIRTVTRPRVWAYLRGAWNWIEMRIWPW